MLCSAIRDKTKELITAELRIKSADEFVLAVTNGRIQLAFRNEIKKIFPLKAFEFKKIDIRESN
jgi:ribosomal protein S3AE